MKIFFIIIFCCFLLNNTVIACETGFACSIDKLNEKQLLQENLIAEIINDLFEKEINEDIFFAKLDENTEYDDLFIYRNFVLKTL